VIDRIEIVSLAVSALLLVVVLELVRRRRLTEEYSFLWIFAAVALLLLSVKREILQTAASWLGVPYPPAVLLMVLIFTVFVASLWFSVILSRQRRQIERLIEETAILSAELRELRAEPLRSPRADDHRSRRAGERIGGREGQREQDRTDSVPKRNRIN
jgi:hypothetical protein